MQSKVLGIIPARYASTRFPGKPLALIRGKSMIMRVYERAKECSSLSRVIVATDDQRIFSHVSESGGEVMMTSAEHRSGTERIGEAVNLIRAEEPGSVYDLVVNIQGDEPLLNPLQIDEVLKCFSDPSVQIGTLMKIITEKDELFNPNVVKLVTDRQGRALYFSRSPIPFLRGVPEQQWKDDHPYFKHIGIYAYRTEVLRELVSLPAATLELAESLEQLRWLEHGYRIQVEQTDTESVAVDTPEDLLKFTNNIA